MSVQIHRTCCCLLVVPKAYNPLEGLTVLVVFLFPSLKSFHLCCPQEELVESNPAAVVCRPVFVMADLPRCG